MTKRGYLSIFLVGLVVIFLAQRLLTPASEKAGTRQRTAPQVPVARIILEDTDKMSPEWNPAEKLLEACAEMGYCEIELNGVRISLPCRPIKTTGKKDSIIIHRNNIQQPKPLLDGPGVPPLPPEKQYDFDQIDQWCRRYKDEPVNVLFGDRVRVDVAVKVIQVLNQYGMLLYLQRGGTPVDKENPTSIRLELNTATDQVAE